jgi:hypothetical protein
MKVYFAYLYLVFFRGIRLSDVLMSLLDNGNMSSVLQVQPLREGLIISFPVQGKRKKERNFEIT